jgi:ribonuclease P protein component
VPDAPSSKDDARRVGSASLRELESLRSSRDFRRVLRHGTRYQEGAIVVVRLPGRSGPPRLGLVVAKGSGGAVTRNRIKRRLRHAAREIDLQPGTDYVIIARKEAAEMAFGQLVAVLNAAVAEGEHA